MDESNIFPGVTTTLYYFNGINDKETISYILNKIKELSLVDNNMTLFIEFIKIAINNQFVFDNLLNSMKEKEKEDLFLNNKDIIIESLFKYSEINGYYFILQIIKFISKYISKDEIEKIIIFNFSNKEEGIINKNSEITDELDEFYQDINVFGNVDKNKKSELLFYKEKYLFFYSIFNRKIINYETIAVLFEYCPKIPLILYLFPFLKRTLKEIFSFKIMNYISYFSIQKNKEKIKELSKNFYDLSLFFESIISKNEIINSFDAFEQKLFVYYIQIMILEITPENLEKYVGYEAENNKKIKGDGKNSFNSLELFIILAIYEIKGTPIISIKNDFQKFYKNIYQYIIKFKELKIYQLCLKQSFDNKFLEYFKNILENNKEEYLKRIKNHPWINNFDLIIDKESYLLLDEDIPIENYILDLIKDDNIIPFFDSNKIDEFYSKLHNNLFFENKSYYKEFIYSLLNFDTTSSIIIQKSDNKFDCKYGEVFREYVNYLQIIISIYKFINLNKYENENLFEINILNEELSEKTKNKLISLKNSIKIEQIQYYIINTYENLNMGNNIFFISIKNFTKNDINNKEIKALKNISNDKISILNYFNYLNLICITILKWFDKFEQIDKFEDFRTNLYDKEFGLKRYFLNERIKINYMENKNKDIAKKNYDDSLYKIGKKLFYNEFDQNERGITELSISFYFNTEKEEFLETISDINLLQFLNNKINSIIRFITDYEKLDKKFYKQDNNYFNELISLEENIIQKKVKDLFLELTGLYQFDSNDKILNLSEYFFQTNKYIICSYLIKSESNCYFQPTFEDCITFIKYEINKFFFIYLFPCLSFNYSIDVFSKNLNCYSNKLKYHEYIDYSIIINEIKTTKFHNSDNLNSLFQIRAIDYIINGDSFFRIFLDELYIKKYWQININKHTFERKNIDETFQIKIVQGKKFTIQDLKQLIKEGNIENNFDNSEKETEKIKSKYSKSSLLKETNNKNKKIKYKLKLEPSQIFYSIIGINQFKRKNTPAIGFSGHIPNNKFCIGNNQENTNKVFNSKITIKNINDFKLLKYKKIKNYSEKRHFKQEKKKNKYLNVFDLIFKIKSCRINIIELEKNDISEIVKAYSEENTFISLLNYNFQDKTQEEVNSEMKKIDFNSNI